MLRADGTFYLHLDPRESHYCKVLLDEIFGRECFLNELVWAYDYGARTKRRWPAKHDTILVYVKDPAAYWFDAEAVDREPYMAPGLVTAEKAARGKLPTDVWWHTIVSPTGREKTGYPTQKPLGVLRRIVAASSREGDWCLDFFAGSGTLGAAALEAGRRPILCDSSPDAVEVMREPARPSGVHDRPGRRCLRLEAPARIESDAQAETVDLPRTTLCTGVNFGSISPSRSSAAGTTSDSANAANASADSQRSAMNIDPSSFTPAMWIAHGMCRVVTHVRRHLADHVVVDVRVRIDVHLHDHVVLRAAALRDHVVELRDGGRARLHLRVRERRAERRRRRTRSASPPTPRRRS